MTIPKFLNYLKTEPLEISFGETMALIDAHYVFTPTAFKNGPLHNEPGQNVGSCKLFSFAKLHKLSQDETLACFGTYYREEVQGHPEGEGHQNIRQFMVTGWAGISFENEALHIK